MGGSNSTGKSRLFGICARFLIVALAACAAFGQDTPQRPEQVSPPLRISVDRVNVGVVVTGFRDHFVEHLRRDQFEIRDNGVKQPLTAFLSIDDPAQIVLMLECGPAAYLFRAQLVHTADTLLIRLAPSDRVAVVCYDTSPQLLVDFTADKRDVAATLRGINFAAGFAEVNLSSSLFAVLDSLRSVQGKKTIVLVTSGIDTSPPTSPEALRAKLGASDVRIVAVSTAQEMQKMPRWRKIPAEQREERKEVKRTLNQASQSLREISDLTGGRIFMPNSSKDFDRASEEIAGIVRHEYDLEFAPAIHDGKLHNLEVRVRNHSYTVKYRQFYLAPSPAN